MATADKARKINKITGERFRIARLACWLTIPQAAKVLQVTERTLHNWESGACRVPYAAYRLMRILATGPKPLAVHSPFGGVAITSHRVAAR